MTSNPFTTVKVLTAILGVAVLGMYVWHQAYALIQGPQITLSAPVSQSDDSAFVQVNGRAANISYLYLNGRQIYVNGQGVFSEKLLPADGYNIIEVRAKGRFGRVRRKTVELVYHPRNIAQSRGTSSPEALSQHPKYREL